MDDIGCDLFALTKSWMTSAVKNLHPLADLAVVYNVVNDKVLATLD